MTIEKIASSQSGVCLAYHKTVAQNDVLPGVIFCGGFMSDMEGSKATFLEQQCAARGQGFVRFDYAGHGASDGYFTDSTIGSWLQDAETILTHVATGPQIVIGSSMGGWIALMLALKHPDLVKGLIGIAAAPDFTQEMYDDLFDEAQKRQLAEEGLIYLPSDYGEPYPITEQLIEEGRNHLLLNKDAIDIACPAHFLHGKGDTVVPWEKSLRIKDLMTSADVSVDFVDAGDHSLSCDAGLALLETALHQMTDRLSAQGDSQEDSRDTA